MNISEIIFTILGIFLFLFGAAITIFPNEIGRWLKTHSILSNNSFYLTGYVLGIIGLAILMIIFWR